MGYLLKEALKSFCGLNQWAYAVFWKIGCQNPKLLIWEDCYYETAADSVFSTILTSQIGVQAGNRVSLLINEMMMRNQVHIVGEGMVGRAAFTGNHQWIHSENYLRDVHPPEVLNEARHQYSAGMQTVAVIPILPHGVVQLGSLLAVVENVEFVSDVKNLIFQLGCISGALLSENITGNATDGSEDIGTPISYGPSVSADQLEKIKTIKAKSGNGEHTASGERQVQIYPKSTASTFHTHNLTQASVMPRENYCRSEAMKPNISVTKQLENGFTGAIVIPPNLDTWVKQQAPSHDSGYGFNHQSQSAVGQSGASYSSLKLAEDPMSSDSIFRDHVNSNCSASHSFVTSQPKMTGAGKTYDSAPMFGVSDSNNILPSYLNSIPASISNLNRLAEISPLSSQMFGINDSGTRSRMTQGSSAQVVNLTNNNQTQIKEAPDEHMPLSDLIPSFFQGFPEHSSSIQSPGSRNALEVSCVVQSHSEDGLFDIFDTDLFNLFGGNNQSSSVNGPYTEKHKGPDSNIGVSKSIVFSATGSDNLLDAVVSKAHFAVNQSLSDNASCRTALTKISDRATMSNHIPREGFFHPKTLCREGMLGTSFFISGCSKEDAGDCSQTSSIYGSQISSWVEEGKNVKRDTSVSTAYSKRPEDISKSSRKRLKPGENPRPRPKDRQMIQDRVKELREIVPNAAKCSIDALLERTIKHMLFLQSVTKHADKLKQTGESKIISKEGGLLLKDNFEGGATWAFEVGSQSMVCPIIVEDLNPPRQMLVEMLCEERGLFLEIADIVRGLGLTILKGVMEARNDKIWARFAVEANRDVTRMEIFISLVGLLEKTMKSSAVSANNIDIENMMLRHSFQQAPCIPSTDRPGSVP